VQATCCLHNFIINHEDYRYYSTVTPADDIFTQKTFQDYVNETQSSCKSAASIRDIFAEYFEGDGAVTWQWEKVLRNEF